MLSKEIKELYDSGKIEVIYAKHIKYIDIIDKWAEIFVSGDLLSEYELKFSQQQLNGSQSKLNNIAGCLEALLIEYENNYFIKEEKTFDKVRIQDKDHCKAKARLDVSDLRRYASDFTRYVNSAQNAVITVQSLLKRQTIAKANNEIDYTGDTANVKETTKKWDA